MSFNATSHRHGQWEPSLPLSLRLALREMRGGISGFYVFLACVILGVAAIAGIKSVSGALNAGIQNEGRQILGGDFEASLNHRRATDKERKFLSSYGQLSEIATLRGMARRTDGKGQALVSLKAVDTQYPLFGSVRIKDNSHLHSTISVPLETSPSKNTRNLGVNLGVVVDPDLLKRLEVKLGDKIKIGTGEVEIKGLIAREPDRLSGRPALGPRIIMSISALKAVGLVQRGSLIRWAYRVKLKPELNSDNALQTVRQAIKTDYAQSGFMLQDRNNPAPIVRRAINRMDLFLMLVSLTALLIGGIGIANGVTSYLDRKKKVIAAFKSLGATSKTALKVYLVQVVLIALLGITVGLGIGAIVPILLSAWAGDLLPFHLVIRADLNALMLGAAYGIIVSLLFTLWPLGQAIRVRPRILMREATSDKHVLPSLLFVIASLVSLLALIAVTALSSKEPHIALYFCLGLLTALLVFFILGTLLQKSLQRVPRSANTNLALSLSNLSAPGGLTRATIASLGTGLSLLVALSLVDRSLVTELRSGLPKNAPNYFFLDIPKGGYQQFSELIKNKHPNADLQVAPMLRGRIVSLAGTTAEDIKAPPNAKWVLNGDRGLTYEEELPKGSELVTGQWWEKNHNGENLVSFDAELGEALGLKLGDEVTVNVLGRNVTAKIANFRTIKWESLSINFVMIFSPNTLKAAPFNMLATLKLSDEGGQAKAENTSKLMSELSQTFPAITVISVKDTVDAVSKIYTSLITAIRIAGGLTLIAGALVLAGALATAQSRRIYQAVILKTVGATKAQILRAHLTEYIILSALTSLFATAIGILIAWLTMTQIMEMPFTFSWMAVIQALGLAVTLVTLFGLYGSRRVLQAKITEQLRRIGT